MEGIGGSGYSEWIVLRWHKLPVFPKGSRQQHNDYYIIIRQVIVISIGIGGFVRGGLN